MTIRVLLADDQALLRGTFRLLIDSADDLEVVGEASTGAEAVASALQTRPDVILMDIRMPDMDGIEASRRIGAEESLQATRVLVLTTFETDELVIAALRAGASGFLGKGVAPAALLDAVRTVAGGDQLLSPAATRALIERTLATPETTFRAAALESPLTERELEVTRLVAAGLSNEEIGSQLYISPATAKTHVNRAMMKTASRDRAQLVVYAYQAGLAHPGSAPVG